MFELQFLQGVVFSHMLRRSVGPPHFYFSYDLNSLTSPLLRHGVQEQEILVSFYFLLMIYIYNEKILLAFQISTFIILYEVF